MLEGVIKEGRKEGMKEKIFKEGRKEGRKKGRYRYQDFQESNGICGHIANDDDEYISRTMKLSTAVMAPTTV